MVREKYDAVITAFAVPGERKRGAAVVRERRLRTGSGVVTSHCCSLDRAMKLGHHHSIRRSVQ
ncbi:hypothetical protein [Streptomyces lydicus]|uniref:hypothetical protein n=1 Tax=Streptomyces lydicus TaxID=47763 RepID=UPI0034199473